MATTEKIPYLDPNGLLFAFKVIKADMQPKETGKGLSTNDFTDAYKKAVDDNSSSRHTHSNKSVLDNITSDKVANWDNAEANVIETIKVNNVALTPTSKAVNIPVPTKVSELANDSNYITKASDITGNANSATKATQDSEGNVINTTYAKLNNPSFTGTPTVPTPAESDNSTRIASTAFVANAIIKALAGITGITLQKVTSLPETGEVGVIYLIAHEHGTNDTHDEYIWTGTEWEKIGTTDIDLSAYAKKSDIVPLTNDEIDSLWASA